MRACPTAPNGHGKLAVEYRGGRLESPGVAAARHPSNSATTPWRPAQLVLDPRTMAGRGLCSSATGSPTGAMSSGRRDSPELHVKFLLW